MSTEEKKQAKVNTEEKEKVLTEEANKGEEEPLGLWQWVLAALTSSSTVCNPSSLATIVCDVTDCRNPGLYVQYKERYTAAKDTEKRLQRKATRPMVLALLKAGLVSDKHAKQYPSVSEVEVVYSAKEEKTSTISCSITTATSSKQASSWVDETAEAVAGCVVSQKIEAEPIEDDILDGNSSYYDSISEQKGPTTSSTRLVSGKEVKHVYSRVLYKYAMY